MNSLPVGNSEPACSPFFPANPYTGCASVRERAELRVAVQPDRVAHRRGVERGAEPVRADDVPAHRPGHPRVPGPPGPRVRHQRDHAGLAANQTLRCQSWVDVSAAELFAPPASAGSTSFASYVDSAGRIEAIWFLFTDTPWLKVWSLAPTKPLLSAQVTSPYNYAFTNSVTSAENTFFDEVAAGDTGGTPAFEGIAISLVDTGLVFDGGWDIWGHSQDVLLYVKPSTVRIVEAGFAVLTSRASIQQVVSDFYVHTPACSANVQQVAAALHYAHDQRLIHRDVKPENMLLNASDEVLLSDFGLALLTPQSSPYSTHLMDRQVAGTAAYLAPEQVQGRPVPASDQYALGIVVYEWLCGIPPFRGTFIEIVAQHLSLSPQPLREFVPELTATIEAVVLKALAKEPQQRFTDVQAFAAALTQESRGEWHLPPTLDAIPHTGEEALPALLQAETVDSTQILQPVWKMPALFTSFIGREQAMADICELFKHPELRLVTLVGPGGIGKTRLSVQVATAMRTFFPDGVCFVPLAAISDARLLVPALARELDIRDVGEQSLLDQVKVALRSTRFLLVLDNFRAHRGGGPAVGGTARCLPWPQIAGHKSGGVAYPGRTGGSRPASGVAQPHTATGG